MIIDHINGEDYDHDDDICDDDQDQVADDILPQTSVAPDQLAEDQHS